MLGPYITLHERTEDNENGSPSSGMLGYGYRRPLPPLLLHLSRLSLCTNYRAAAIYSPGTVAKTINRTSVWSLPNGSIMRNMWRLVRRLLNDTVPWQLYTRRVLLRMMLIMAKHFHLKRSGTDVIYEIPCHHNSNLQLWIIHTMCLETLTEVKVQSTVRTNHGLA